MSVSSRPGFPNGTFGWLVIVVVCGLTVISAVGVGIGGEAGHSPSGGPRTAHGVTSAPHGKGQAPTASATAPSHCQGGSTHGGCEASPASSFIPYVEKTFVEANGTSVPGNFLAANGLEPKDVAYVSANGMIYSVDYGSASLSIINPATNKVVGGIQLAFGLSAVTYDPALGELFVSDGVGVVVVNVTTNTVVTNITTQDGAWGVAYDPVTYTVYVADYDTANVSVISTATNSVTATVPVGPYPVGVTYDSGQGEIFVGDIGPSAPGVTIINATTNEVVDTVYLGMDPDYVLYDPLDGDVYVANLYTITVLNGTTDAVVVNFTMNGFAGEFTFDSGKGEIFASIRYPGT